MNIFNGPFSRWTCEINPKNLAAPVGSPKTDEDKKGRKTKCFWVETKKGLSSLSDGAGGRGG